MTDKEMTDVDMALNWIRSQGWNEENLPSDELLQMEQAFLAGLKASENGVHWHDLREDPNDLPKRDKTFSTEVSVTVITYPLNFGLYYFFDKKWYSNGKEIKVDRWCEIPKYTGKK